MSETKTYTVTKLAGPKVAGRRAKAGDELKLTEPEARSELLAGVIVAGGKDEDGAKVSDPLAGSPKLADIQARAMGMDRAPKDEPNPETGPAEPAGAKDPAEPTTPKKSAGARAGAETPAS